MNAMLLSKGNCKGCDYSHHAHESEEHLKAVAIEPSQSWQINEAQESY
jgi:hypothetical protein